MSKNKTSYAWKRLKSFIYDLSSADEDVKNVTVAKKVLHLHYKSALSSSASSHNNSSVLNEMEEGDWDGSLSFSSSTLQEVDAPATSSTP